MAHSFIAYIDESGDDGLTGRFRQAGIGGGSSHWLTIGAAVWRHSRDLDAVQWAKDIAAKLPAQRRNKILHFADFDHNQRIMAIQSLCDKPMRICCVIANKPIIPTGIYTEKNQLYHYKTRFLIERISWMCRDMRKVVPEGDGRVKIIFARRGGMSYPDFQEYMHRLKAMDDPGVTIHWPVIDIDAIEAWDQPAKYGLQLADLAISGITAALEPDFYGNSEVRFAKLLKSHVYHRQNNFLSYGAKMFPTPDKLVLNEQQLEFVKLFGG